MNTDKLMNEVVRTGESASKIVNSKIRTLTKVKIPAIHLYLFNKLFNVYVSASAMTDILKYDGANGKCYIASMAIILAMEPNDLVIKGNLAPEHKDGWPHQWIEFVFNDKWYVLDSSFVGVYEKEDYYNTFKPAILSKKSNAEWMEDDFAKKHAQIMRIQSQSWDLNLFLYYQGRYVEQVKNDLYNNIELDEAGNVKAYHSPYMWF